MIALRRNSPEFKSVICRRLSNKKRTLRFFFCGFMIFHSKKKISTSCPPCPSFDKSKVGMNIKHQFFPRFGWMCPAPRGWHLVGSHPQNQLIFQCRAGHPTTDCWQGLLPGIGLKKGRRNVPGMWYSLGGILLEAGIDKWSE